MRGWIYVISNEAMPGLVKVGYSSKDPEERAKELDHTGAPYPYIVEYDVLIEGELYQVEQRVHRSLSSYNEGKEWFRCTAEKAVTAIRQAIKNMVIAESFKKVDREEAERLERLREIELERLKRGRELEESKRIEKQKQLEKILWEEKNAIEYYKIPPGKKFYNLDLSGFIVHWFWGSIVGLILNLGLGFLVSHFSTIGEMGRIWEWMFKLSPLTGLALALYYRDRKKQSPEYISFMKERDERLEEIRKKKEELQSKK